MYCSLVNCDDFDCCCWNFAAPFLREICQTVVHEHHTMVFVLLEGSMTANRKETALCTDLAVCQLRQLRIVKTPIRWALYIAAKTSTMLKLCSKLCSTQNFCFTYADQRSTCNNTKYKFLVKLYLWKNWNKISHDRTIFWSFFFDVSCKRFRSHAEFDH